MNNTLRGRRAGRECSALTKPREEVGRSPLPAPKCVLKRSPRRALGPAIRQLLLVTAAQSPQTATCGARFLSEPNLAYTTLLSRPRAVASANNHKNRSQHPTLSFYFISISDGANCLRCGWAAAPRRDPQLSLRPPF